MNSADISAKAGRLRRSQRKIKILIRDGFRCRYCGRDLGADVDSFAAATVDHVVPLAAGGSNRQVNLAAACYVCNILKGRFESASLEEALKCIAERRTALARTLESARATAKTLAELNADAV